MPFRTFVGFVETIELNLINSHKNNKVSCKGIVSELLIFGDNPLIAEKAEIFSRLKLLKKVIAT